jgi:hypothetical protein
MLLWKAAQDQHREVGRAGADRRQRIDAALIGHRDVHHYHVDLALAHDVQRLASVGRLGNDVEVGLIGEELAQPGAHHGMVVNDGNSDHGGLLHSATHDRTFRGARPWPT